MSKSKQTNSTANISINGIVIEKLDKYAYLGQEVVIEDNQTNEVNKRNRLAGITCSKLKCAFIDIHVNINSKQKL